MLEFKKRISAKALDETVEMFYRFLEEKGEYKVVYTNRKNGKAKFYRNGKWYSGPGIKDGKVYLSFIRLNSDKCGGHVSGTKVSCLYNFMVSIMNNYEDKKDTLNHQNDYIDEEYTYDMVTLTE